MNKLATIVKRYSYVATAAVLSLGMLMPLILSGSAGAAQLEARSVTLSNAAPGATAVTYKFQFTVATTGTVSGVILNFCNDTSGPIAGTACTSPSMTLGTTITSFLGGAGGVTDISAGWTAATLSAGGSSSLNLEDSSAASWADGDVITIEVSGFTNPSPTDNVANTTYTRMFTYAAADASDGYTPATPGATADDGAAAFSIVPLVNVSATVRETLTFCVGGGQTSTPTASSIYNGCTGNADGGNDGTGSTITAPSIKLGNTTSGVTVLDETAVYTGDIFYQLTTNAATGVTVSMKGASQHLLSGLTNQIPSVGDTAGAITPGTAAFGVNVATPGDASTGTDLAKVAPFEDGTAASSYVMPTTVTSTYGAPFASTLTPVRNANGKLTFAATASPDTKAGVYSAQYSLIATPKY